ncbi:hypothetical protein ACOMHN_049978 [Nucella lapillus]
MRGIQTQKINRQTGHRQRQKDRQKPTERKRNRETPGDNDKDAIDVSVVYSCLNRYVMPEEYSVREIASLLCGSGLFWVAGGWTGSSLVISVPSAALGLTFSARIRACLGCHSVLSPGLGPTRCDLFHNVIDFKKAFDRVWHDGLWQVMRNYNIDSNIMDVIKALFDDSKSAALLNNQIG